MNKGKTTDVTKVCQNTQTLNDLSRWFKIQIMAKSLVTNEYKYNLQKRNFVLVANHS